MSLLGVGFVAEKGVQLGGMTWRGGGRKLEPAYAALQIARPKRIIAEAG